MRYYRLYENLTERTALGYGLNGGRWNHSGTPLIYAANSRSLSLMEIYSIKGPVVANATWMIATLEIKKDIPMLDESALPINWSKRPHTKNTKNFGTTWANSKGSLCLQVPSARIPLSGYPLEHNLLINPLHPDFNSEISIVNIEEFKFRIN